MKKYVYAVCDAGHGDSTVICVTDTYEEAVRRARANGDLSDDEKADLMEECGETWEEDIYNDIDLFNEIYMSMFSINSVAYYTEDKKE